VFSNSSNVAISNISKQSPIPSPGVICEIVSQTKSEEEEKLLMGKVEDLFSEMDADESGTISREEFEQKTVRGG
jgi:Ca2+-binding EF-hand superfamily protein